MDVTISHDPFAPDDAFTQNAAGDWVDTRQDPAAAAAAVEQRLIWGVGIVNVPAQPPTESYVDLSAAELKDRVKARQLTVKGRKNKPNLIAALEAADQAESETTMDFPADRFTRAGATPAELEVLAAEWDALDDAAKGTLVAHFASISDGDIAEQLDDQRAAGRFDEPEPAETYDGDDWDAERVEKEVADRKLEVTGTGKNGNVLKADRIAALISDDIARAESAATNDGEGLPDNGTPGD